MSGTDPTHPAPPPRDDPGHPRAHFPIDTQRPPRVTQQPTGYPGGSGVAPLPHPGTPAQRASATATPPVEANLSPSAGWRARSPSPSPGAVPVWEQRTARGSAVLSRRQNWYARYRWAVVIGLVLLIVLVPVLVLLGAQQSGGSHAISTPNTQVSAGPHVRAPYTPPMAASASQLDGLASLSAGARLAYVNALLAHMTLAQKIGQMTMINVDGTAMTPDIAAYIQQFQPGAVILYDGNLRSEPQAKALIRQLQEASPVPLLVMVDQEGGQVDRMANIDGVAPSATWYGEHGTTSTIEAQGITDAAHMADIGINVNLAPVVDISRVPGGQGALVDRTYGTTPSIVTTMAGAYLTGLQKSGKVVGTLKHFPGLGDAAINPHQQLPVVGETLAQLEATDLVPYKTLLATGHVYMIMSTHILFPKIDPTYPTTLSSIITTGLLREKLGYQGVITTDDVFMGALNLNYPMQEIFVRAVQAGNDIICCTWNSGEISAFLSIIQEAVANGTISQARIDTSVRRILLLKLQLGLPLPKVS